MQYEARRNESRCHHGSWNGEADCLKRPVCTIDLMIKGRWVLLLAGTLGLTGCVIERPGPIQNESQAIDRDASESVRVNLDMGAGTLKAGGGTDKLAAADFHYNVPSWKPEVHYASTAGHGSLTIKQEGHITSGIGNANNEWDIRLNREVPLAIETHLGAGEAHLDLGGLTLRSLDVGMGQGSSSWICGGLRRRATKFEWKAASAKPTFTYRPALVWKRK
jgi:hypothetical protein